MGKNRKPSKSDTGTGRSTTKAGQATGAKRRAEKPGTSRKQPRSNEGPEAPRQEPDTGAPMGTIFGRTDQLGTIVSRGFDLAEAGISLGLNLLNRVGSMTQDSLIEKITAPFTAQAAQSQSSMEHESPAASAPATRGGDEVTYVTNRLPIVPGQVCTVSFSINNDSPATPRKVRLHCEGFIGEHTGTRIDNAVLSVRPPARSIDPMDFEKFVLTGTLPPDLPHDVYQGWIVVTSDNVLRIPVRLTVSDAM